MSETTTNNGLICYSTGTLANVMNWKAEKLASGEWLNGPLTRLSSTEYMQELSRIPTPEPLENSNGQESE
jgi:hypothetical protein